MRPQGQSLDDVAARADSRIEDARLVSASAEGGDGGEGVKRGQRAIDLSAPVVADDNAVDACRLLLRAQRPLGVGVGPPRVLSLAILCNKVRVGEYVGDASTGQEGIVGRVEISEPPAEDPSVQGDDEDLVPSLSRPLEDGLGQLIVRRPVELKLGFGASLSRESALGGHLLDGPI